MTAELWSAVLSAVVAGALGYAAKYARDRLTTVLVRDRILRRAWGFLQRPTHLFLPIANVSRVGAAGGYGDLLAMSRVVTLTNMYFPPGNQLTIHTNQTVFEQVQDQNLVILGAGKYNRVYREMIERLNPPLHFFDTATESFQEIRNRDRSIVYSPAYDENGSVVYDIGLIVLARNPLNHNCKVLIAAGSHTYGSAAAIEFLADPKNLREIRANLTQNFLLVVGAAISAHAASRIERISNVLTW
jgi:hypothetical protein